MTGSYGPRDSQDIFVYKFDTRLGKGTFVSSLSGIENPSYLTLAPGGHFVYAVSETHGAGGGSVYALSFDAKKGRVKIRNHLPSGGMDPCYITTDETGSRVFSANYSSGSLAVFSVGENGCLDSMLQHIQLRGHSINKMRQLAAHAHCVLVMPGNRDVFVSDLGSDKVMSYRLDAQTGILSAGDPPFTRVSPGSGPRHLVAGPGGRFVYLIHEIGGQITVFDRKQGSLTRIQTVSTVPKGFKGKISASAIHMAPDGKFLYASDRDDLNDIVIFAVDPHSGELSFSGRLDAGGPVPRDFVISPDGQYLLVGHQDDSPVSVFRRNVLTGALTRTKQTIPVSHAVCLLMFPR